MNVNQTISYIRSCVGDRKVTVKYIFDARHLPAVIRLHGINGYIDVPLSLYNEKLLALKNSQEVVTIGRLPLCDFQVDTYEDNLISRVHVIWQKVGDKFILVNCGIYGTTAFEKMPDGLKEIPSQDKPWVDFEK